MNRVHPLSDDEVEALERLPVVIVMQAAQHGARDEFSNPLWLGPTLWVARGSLPNPRVGPGVQCH